MRKKMLSLFLALTTVLSLSLSACSEAPVMPEPQISKSAPQKPTVGENYYGSVNFNYLSRGQIPYGESGYGLFDNTRYEMEQYVKDLIDRCVNSQPVSGSFEEMVKEMYLQYTNTDARNEAGVDTLLYLAGMIEQCNTTDELVGVMGYLYQNCGVSSFFRPDVLPNFLDSSTNTLYLMNMNTLGNMKENFTRTDAGPESMGQYVKDTLTFMNVEPEEAKQRAKNVVRLINEIMLATMDSANMMNMTKHLKLYNKTEVQSIFSNINADNMLQAFGFGTIEQCIVYDEGQAAKINELLTQEHIREIKDYLMTCIMFEYSDVLPPTYLKDLVSLSDSTKDIDDSAKRYIANILEMEVGILYGREICNDQLISTVSTMVSQIQDSCRDLIRHCDRLSEDSKNKYLQKIDHMVVKLGYDHAWTAPFTITPAADGGTFIENVMAIKRGRKQKLIASIQQTPDRNAWEMSAIEVNATYYPMSNTFEIPAVMMSKAFINPADNEYYNLGKLGYVIGHEMSHGFDSNGFQFDDYGNYKPEWIGAEDREKYRQLMDRVITYYDNFKLLDIYNIKGEQTLSENLADLSSVQCLLHITDDPDNLRHLLEGIAAQWASLTVVSNLVMELDGEIHSPGEARTNAVVSCMDAFYKVYDIKETDKMYLAPENRIKVW